MDCCVVAKRYKRSRAADRGAGAGMHLKGEISTSNSLASVFDRQRVANKVLAELIGGEMMAELHLPMYDPTPQQHNYPLTFSEVLNTSHRSIKVDGRDVSIGETVDFPRSDPWSQLAITTIQELQSEGMFKGNINIIEAGVGDGRNLLQAIGVGRDGGNIDGEWKGRLIGIDIDPRRAALAIRNFKAVGLASHQFDVLSSDAAGAIKDYSERIMRGDAEQLTGFAIALLPQAPLDNGTKSSADGFDEDLASLDRVRKMTLQGRNVSDYGLTLNAAFLSEFRKCVHQKDLKLLIIVSDRVPRNVVQELFSKTGWEEIRHNVTPEPVRQDPDTSVQYIVDSCFHNGDPHVSFYEHLKEGGYRQISAEEAEARRKAYLECGQAGELNVYHYVFAYLLKPKADPGIEA